MNKFEELIKNNLKFEAEITGKEICKANLIISLIRSIIAFAVMLAVGVLLCVHYMPAESEAAKRVALVGALFLFGAVFEFSMIIRGIVVLAIFPRLKFD